MAEPEGGKVPGYYLGATSHHGKAASTDTAISSPSTAVLPATTTLHPAGLLTTSCNYYVGAELRGGSWRRRLMIIVRILARRPDGCSALDCMSPPLASGVARLRTSSMTSTSSSP